MNMSIICPLCSSAPAESYRTIQNRKLFSCPDCSLLYAHPSELLSPANEKKRYEFHRNSPADKAYCDFLGRLVEPLAQILSEGCTGLDYGCGPGPTLSHLMKSMGFSVADYDPFFYPHDELLKHKYDFITCTEVFEHFFSAGTELKKILGMLKTNGVLAVMTEIISDTTDISDWHYLREPSHVCFFHSETMEWIADNHDLVMSSPHKNVRFFKKTWSEFQNEK
jgi:hypothetical protein